MNPFLVREVQPPLIYVGGDGRLNNTQSNKSLYHFYLYFYLLHLFFFFLVLRLFFLLQGGKPRGPRGDHVDLGQPIAATRLDGLSPERVGFRVYKSARRIACVPRFPDGSPSTWAAVHHPRCWTYTVTCSCANTLFGDSAGDEALNGLRPIFSTKGSSSRVCNPQR